MRKQVTRLKAQFIGISMLLLYAFVFIGSSYLHDHHHDAYSKTEKVSTDLSCELCKVAPQKNFTFHNFNFIFEYTKIQVKYNKTVEEIATEKIHQFLNKAPPAQA